MRAGRLRHTVTLERQVTTQDEYGQRVDSWNPIVTVRASVEPIRGKEFFAASAERAELTTRVRIRYSEDVENLRPWDRVVHDGANYDIQSIINTDERYKELQLMCKEVLEGDTVPIFIPPSEDPDYALFRDSSQVQFINSDNAEFT